LNGLPLERGLRAALLGALIVGLQVGGSSQAHFAVSRQSLRGLIAEADLVVHARILRIDELVPGDAPEAWTRRALQLEALQVIKGPGKPGQRLEFAQHGHGVPPYHPGDEALLFLRSVSKSRELVGLAAEDGPVWYSSQEHDDAYVLSAGSRQAVLRAAKRYAAIEKMPRNERTEALRRITVKSLASKDARLARSALRDLRAAPERPLVTGGDLASLLAVVDDPSAPTDVRLGLLAELQQRGLLRGDRRWVKLLRTATPGNRLAVVQAAGAHGGPDTRAELVRILRGSDISLASAAAVALGSPGNAPAIAPLSEALSAGEPRLAMSAIRGLSAIGTSEAEAVIRDAAESHPDPRVRRRATAELRLLSSRQTP
jgi:hypothetical protein